MGITMPRKSRTSRSAGKEKKAPKYAEGTRVTFKNGAEAVAQANGQLRIVKGASAASMRKLAADRKKAPYTDTYKHISERAAKRAFESHYRNRVSKAKNQERGNRMARSYDLNHSEAEDRIVDDARYRRAPHRYDYRADGEHGWTDAGPKQRKPRSEKQLANDARLKKNPPRRKQSGGRPRTKGSKNKVQTVCGFDEGTNR